MSLFADEGQGSSNHKIRLTLWDSTAQVVCVCTLASMPMCAIEMTEVGSCEDEVQLISLS